ncbi:MAG: hypothetical protein A2Z04_07040 [Chloroflexi bacterium RBG_16_57_9]|nr:MAG: hypothetical protein A2Z04_07040 [Chloroflexi bacterium RBG_16_57_9]
MVDGLPQERTVKDGVVRVVFPKGKAGRVTVLWNETPTSTQVTVDALKPQAQLVDQDGTIRDLQAQDGKYRIDLPGATNRGNLGPNDYAVGGRTFLLVEVDKPVATEIPRPANLSILGGDFGTPRRGFDVGIDTKGNRFARLTVGGANRPVSRLAYVLRIPPDLRQPALTFDYALEGGGDLFTVIVCGDSRLTSQPLLVASKPADWQHAQFDMTRFRGRTVRVEFALTRQPEGGRTVVKLDNLRLQEGTGKQD